MYVSVSLAPWLLVRLAPPRLCYLGLVLERRVHSSLTMARRMRPPDISLKQHHASPVLPGLVKCPRLCDTIYSDRFPARQKHLREYLFRGDRMESGAVMFPESVQLSRLAGVSVASHRS